MIRLSQAMAAYITHNFDQLIETTNLTEIQPFDLHLKSLPA